MNVDIFGRSYCRLCSLILYIYIYLYFIYHSCKLFLCFGLYISSGFCSALILVPKTFTSVICSKMASQNVATSFLSERFMVRFVHKTVNTWWKLFVSCRNHYGTMQEKTMEKHTLLPWKVAPRHTESFPEPMWFRLLISYLMQCGAKLQSCKCWKFAPLLVVLVI